MRGCSISSVLLPPCTCHSRSLSTSTISKARYANVHIDGKLAYRMPPRRRMPPSYPAQFQTNVKHSNGSTLIVHTTSPRTNFPLTRDIYNHPLWDFAALSKGVRDEDESGRLGRFARRFKADDSTMSGSESADIMADLLDVGGELKAVDPRLIAKTDRQAKKKAKK